MEVGDDVRKLWKKIQDVIGWTAGMGGCRKDVGIPDVHGGRRLVLVKEVDIPQEKFLVQGCHQIFISLSDI